MINLQPSFVIEDDINVVEMLQRLERAGRTCYKSDDKICEKSAYSFLKMIIEKGHETVLEHEKITVRVICDRGVTHEIVRHRIASYSQESTRYCNYSKDKFGGQISVIKPCFWSGSDPVANEKYLIWENAMLEAEKAYFHLLSLGATPQEARSVLPNSLKTEIVMTMNLREWRHFFRLRITPEAHPQMREIARPLLDKFKEVIPVVFDDISYKG